MLGALLSLVFFVAFPFIAVVVTVYFLASIAFNLLGSTTSKIKRMMVVGESQVWVIYRLLFFSSFWRDEMKTEMKMIICLV